LPAPESGHLDDSRVGLLFVRAWLSRYWLAVCFGTIFVLRARYLVATGDGFDARLYIEASRTWLSGGDPWGFLLDGYGYAAPPPSLIATAPLTLLPSDIAPHLMVVGAAAAAILTIRRLGLPWWWLLFPPLLEAVWNGTLDAYLVLLIVSGHGWLAAVAKIYAAVPLTLLGRWRQLAILGVVLVITGPILPWSAYLQQLPAINERLAVQSIGGMSATAIPILIPIAVAALLLLGRRAVWLAVPALWPSSQWYYGVIALPALARAPLVAAAMSIPIPGLIVAGLVAQVAWNRVVRDQRPGASRTDPSLSE
jgi:hypothetical protein